MAPAVRRYSPMSSDAASGFGVGRSGAEGEDEVGFAPGVRERVRERVRWTVRERVRETVRVRVLALALALPARETAVGFVRSVRVARDGPRVFVDEVGIVVATNLDPAQHASVEVVHRALEPCRGGGSARLRVLATLFPRAANLAADELGQELTCGGEGRGEGDRHGRITLGGCPPGDGRGGTVAEGSRTFRGAGEENERREDERQDQPATRAPPHRRPVARGTLAPWSKRARAN